MIIQFLINFRDRGCVVENRKICYISCIGKVEYTRTYLILKTLASYGFPVTAICPGKIKLNEFEHLITHYCLPLPKTFFWYDGNLINTIAALYYRLKNIILLSLNILRIRPYIIILSEPDAWIIAVLYKKVFGGKIIADIREIYEDRILVLPSWFRSFARKYFRKLTVKLSINTDEILHVSIERQKFYDYLQKPGLIIGSYPEVKQFKEIPTIKDHLPRNVTIIHSGTLRPTYASDQFIEAMRIVTRIRPQARFIVLGGYVKLLKNIDILRNLQKENKLEIKQQLPFGEVLQYYKISDIGISLVLPIDNTHKLAAPQKLYEYFASGIPVIAANVPTMRNIITKNECGIIVDAESPVSIAKGIIRLIDDKYLRQKYGKNARKLIKSIYNWESQTEKLYLLIRAYIVGNNH